MMQVETHDPPHTRTQTQIHTYMHACKHTHACSHTRSHTQHGTLTYSLPQARMHAPEQSVGPQTSRSSLAEWCHGGHLQTLPNLQGLHLQVLGIGGHGIRLCACLCMCARAPIASVNGGILHCCKPLTVMVSRSHKASVVVICLYWGQDKHTSPLVQSFAEGDSMRKHTLTSK